MFFFGKKPAHNIIVLPHPGICPAGEAVPALVGKSIAETLVDKGVELNHSCQFQCSCTTCHIHVMEGQDYLSRKDTEEDRMLATTNIDQQRSRLACQAIYSGGGDVVIEIPD